MPGSRSSSERSGRSPLALILEPARDLAEQTHENVVMFSKHLSNPSIRSALLVGGVDSREQVCCLSILVTSSQTDLLGLCHFVRALQRQVLAQGVEIVTGTIGRLEDMIESGAVSFEHVRFFVLDEADRLLDTGNRSSIRQMFKRIPKMGGGRKDRRLQV